MFKNKNFKLIKNFIQFIFIIIIFIFIFLVSFYHFLNILFLLFNYNSEIVILNEFYSSKIDLDLNKNSNLSYPKDDIRNSNTNFKFELLNILNYYISIFNPALGLIKIGDCYYINFIIFDTRGLIDYLVENNYIEKSIEEPKFLTKCSIPMTAEDLENKAKIDQRDRANLYKSIFVGCYAIFVYFISTRYL